MPQIDSFFVESVFNLISGRQLPQYGKGLHTYPDGDEHNKNIFAACLELEKQGRIYRKIDEPTHVLWSPVDD